MLNLMAVASSSCRDFSVRNKMVKRQTNIVNALLQHCCINKCNTTALSWCIKSMALCPPAVLLPQRSQDTANVQLTRTMSGMTHNPRLTFSRCQPPRSAACWQTGTRHTLSGTRPRGSWPPPALQTRTPPSPMCHWSWKGRCTACSTVPRVHSVSLPASCVDTLLSCLSHTHTHTHTHNQMSNIAFEQRQVFSELNRAIYPQRTISWS